MAALLSIMASSASEISSAANTRRTCSLSVMLDPILAYGNRLIAIERGVSKAGRLPFPVCSITRVHRRVRYYLRLRLIRDADLRTVINRYHHPVGLNYRLHLVAMVSDCEPTTLF